jgi:hypothetical protein
VGDKTTHIHALMATQLKFLTEWHTV